MKNLAQILILIVCTLTSVFAFGLIGGIIGFVFALAAIVLEAVKFTSIHQLHKVEENFKFPLMALIASITGFSMFASHSAIDAALLNHSKNAAQENVLYTQKLEQYKTDYALYKTDVQYQSELSKRVQELQESIQIQTQRPDRNKITDERIAQDRKALRELKQEITTPVAPIEPIRPKTVEIPREVSWIFAVLIEVSALVTSYIGFRKPKIKEPEVKTEPKSDETDEHVKSSVQKSKSVHVQKPKAKSVQKFKSIKEELNLTEAQRIKLYRRLKREGLDWKTFNSNKNNITKAKEFLK